MKRQELIALVEQGTQELVDSGRWQEYLDVMSRFHQYSPCNTMLILLQKPTATQVAGFHTWRKTGRFPRKNTAIAIWAPRYRKQKNEDDDEEHQVMSGFVPVNVFDVSDTYGEPLPTLTDNLQGDDRQPLLDRMVIAAETRWRVDFDLTGPMNGVYFRDGRISLNETNSPNQNCKTLLHEMAHGILGHNGNRAMDEFLAESSAYVAAKALGLDSGGYSFGYLLSWAGGQENAAKAIKEVAQKVLDTANELLALVNGKEAA